MMHKLSLQRSKYSLQNKVIMCTIKIFTETHKYNPHEVIFLKCLVWVWYRVLQYWFKQRSLKRFTESCAETCWDGTAGRRLYNVSCVLGQGRAWAACGNASQKMKNRSIRRKKGGRTDSVITSVSPIHNRPEWFTWGVLYLASHTGKVTAPCTPPFVNSFSLIKSLLLVEHFYWLCCPWEGNLRFVDLPSFLTLPLGICFAEPGRDVCGSNLFPSTQAWCACCNGCSFSLSLYCACCLTYWVNKPSADG